MIGRMTDRRSRTAGLAALLSLVLVAGCGSTGPTSSPAASTASPVPMDTAGPSAAASGGAASPASTPAPATALQCSDAAAPASFAPQPIGPDSLNAVLFSQIEG